MNTSAKIGITMKTDLLVNAFVSNNNKFISKKYSTMYSIEFRSYIKSGDHIGICILTIIASGSRQ